MEEAKRIKWKYVIPALMFLVSFTSFAIGYAEGNKISGNRQVELDKSYDNLITTIKVFVQQCSEQEESVIARHWVNLQGQHQGISFRCEQVKFLASSNTSLNMHYTEQFYEVR